MFYIQQLEKQDCGFACLKILLANSFKRKEFLYLKQDLNHGAYSFKDLIEIAENHGLILNGYKYKKKSDLLIDKPKDILLSIRLDNGAHHMVVLRYIFANKVYLYDPYLGKYSISKNKLLEMWDGTILKVDDVRTMQSIPNKPYSLSITNKAFLIILRLLGIISGILGVFYIDKRITPILSICLMVTCFCFELIYRVISLYHMKKIDKDLLKDKIEIKGNKDLFLQAISNFKSHEVTLLPSFLFSMSISCFIVAIFVLNDLKNFLPISLVFLLAIFDNLILAPMLEFKRKQLEREEDNLKFSSNDDFIFNYLKLSSKSYEFGLKYMLQKSIVAIFIITMVVLFMYFSGIFDLSFIVFYCFGYWFLFNNLSSLINFSKQMDLHKKERCLLTNLINN